MEFLCEMGGEIPTFEEALDDIISGRQYPIEQFDISGEIDTGNPIYKFYQRLIPKYLHRIRPDMQRITDPQGIEWFEIALTPDDAVRPVPAFGV
jgi:hypothetical protein